ncbi:MAG TPA: GIY-YIG nuclease family protein [Anaerolineae bacterium]|nr:GIY-YIG nuclease family protein [Anaerolineae bacterium]
MKNYYVYIMASLSGTLYTGVTNDLERRVFEHKQKQMPGFSSKYNVNRFVYYEETRDIEEALNREKQIKGWLRIKKLELITSCNPKWHDLSDGRYEPK